MAATGRGPAGWRENPPGPVLAEAIRTGRVPSGPAKVTRPISTRDARRLLLILAGADDVAANAILSDVQSGCTIQFAGLELTADDDAQTYLLTVPETRPGLRLDTLNVDWRTVKAGKS